MSSPPIADSPATPAEVSREPRPQSMHGRATAPLQVGTTPESHARGASLRAALPREASYTVSSPTQLPPLSYTRPPFPRSALSRASLPPPSYPRISPHFETSSTLNGAPHGLKRRTEDVEVDRVSAKRQQLPTLEPAPYHQHQYSMTPSVHIRQASEEWLHQHRPPPKSYATPPPYPRLPSPRVDPRSAMRVESARSGFERLATDIDGAEVAPPGDMSPFDTLVWASRIHSNASENNESNFTPSETTSRSRSASATDTNTPDGSNPENGEAGGRGDGLPSAK